MSSRLFTIAMSALALGAGSVATPSDARTIVRVGIGVPVYPRPYRWGYYPGYYPPPPYYYRGPPAVIYPYWDRPHWHRPYYGRPYWRRW